VCAARILITEDDEMVRNLLRLVVERCGCEAEIAGDGVEALRLLNERQFDVVLLDLMMPVMNGYELIPHLRVMTQRPAVVVVTAMMGDRFLELDSDVVTAIVHKPFDVDLLANLLGDIAGRMYAKQPADHGEMIHLSAKPADSGPANREPTTSSRPDVVPPPPPEVRGGD
jgi:CheY-like chemotaxis protein